MIMDEERAREIVTQLFDSPRDCWVKIIRRIDSDSFELQLDGTFTVEELRAIIFLAENQHPDPRLS